MRIIVKCGGKGRHGPCTRMVGIAKDKLTLRKLEKKFCKDHRPYIPIRTLTSKFPCLLDMSILRSDK